MILALAIRRVNFPSSPQRSRSLVGRWGSTCESATNLLDYSCEYSRS